MRARSLMFLLNLFLLRLWLGSRVGPRLSSHSVLVYGASFSICSLVSRSHQIQPQPLVHLLSEREKKKKRLGSLCFPPTPTDFSLSPRSSYEAKKVLVRLFLVKALIFVSGRRGKTENDCWVKLNFFSLVFPFFNSASQTGTESICRAEHTFSNKQ